MGEVLPSWRLLYTQRSQESLTFCKGLNNQQVKLLKVSVTLISRSSSSSSSSSSNSNSSSSSSSNIIVVVVVVVVVLVVVPSLQFGLSRLPKK